MKEQDYEGIKAVVHSDFLDKPAKNTIYYNDRVPFPCPKCGKEATADTSVVLTSYPGQYEYYCPHCGAHGSVLCSEVDSYRFHKDVQAEIGQYIRGKSFYGIRCIICDEEAHHYDDLNKPYVCPECKKAVLAMRKFLEKNND